jgi:PE family
MSFVNAVPAALTGAAGDLAGIGSTIAAANVAAAAPTAGIEVIAADAVSAALVAVFSAHGLGYQSLGAELAELHAQIVQALRSSAGSYAAAEGENVSQLLGHPLLGDGTS